MACSQDRRVVGNLVTKGFFVGTRNPKIRGRNLVVTERTVVGFRTGEINESVQDDFGFARRQRISRQRAPPFWPLRL